MGRFVRSMRPVAALAMKSATVRRLGLRTGACHADRLTAAQSLELLDDINGCTVNVDTFLGPVSRSRR